MPPKKSARATVSPQPWVARIVTIGHGGHAVHCAPDETGARVVVSGHARTVEQFRASLARVPDGDFIVPADTPIVDLTAAPWDALVELSVRGPMVDASVPDAHVSRVGNRITRVTQNTVFGSFDCVGVDVYVRLAQQAGAVVTYTDRDWR